MTDFPHPIANLSTPASFGAEWADPDTGRRMQLANPRGTRSLIFGMRRVDGKWVTVPVVNPERFVEQIPQTWGGFCVVLRAWFDAAQEPPEEDTAPRPTLQEEAERLLGYWEAHGENPETVAKWAVSDLLGILRYILEEQS